MAVQPALSRLAQLVDQPPQPILLVQLALILNQLVQIR